MTKKERMTARCELCLYHADCGFITRNIQHKCPQLSEFEEGYDYAMADAIAWLKEHANEYIVDLSIGYGNPPQLVIGGMCWINMEKAIYG